MATDTPSTRLTPEGYLAAWDADLAAVLDTAEVDSALTVPSCPGWTLADLYTHLGDVYGQKAAAIRDGAPPEPWPPPRPDGFEPLDWLRASAAQLRGSSPAPTP